MKILAENYLTGIPQEMEKYGLCKTLLVRREMIHIKHILTEVMVRKTINLNEQLSHIGWDAMMWFEHLTNRMRRIHRLPRSWTKDFSEFPKVGRNRFFPLLDFLKHDEISITIALDFDGTITNKRFWPLYELCVARAKTVVCTANPTVTNEWFEKKGLSLPNKIYACKGKTAKLNCLVQIANSQDFTLFVDNEPKPYLNVAWLMGVYTFHFANGLINNYSLKTK